MVPQSPPSPARRFFPGLTACLLLCLCGHSLIAFACAFGFTEGFPRPLVFDQTRSAKIGDIPVRVMKFEGRTVYLVQPAGFSDIESLSQDTLPEWLHVPAFNLRDYRTAYFVPPAPQEDASRTLPKYSIAELSLTVLPDGDRFTSDLAPHKKLMSRQSAVCNALVNYMSGGPDMDPELWKQAFGDIGAAGKEFPVCHLIKDNIPVTVTLNLGEGDYTSPEEKARKEQRARELMERIERAQAARLANPKNADESDAATIELFEEFPPGGTPASLHEAVEVTLSFPVKDVGFTLTLALLPLDGRQRCKEALELLLRWRENILAANS